MIRKLLNGDIDRVADIWLKTNLKAHCFIPDQYWKSNYELVKEMMSQSEVYVYEDDKVIQGFVGLNDEYIEGIFVSDEMQSCGVGKLLLDYIKDKKVRLQLNVYQKNARRMPEQFLFTKEKGSLFNVKVLMEPLVKKNTPCYGNGNRNKKEIDY
jgi:putative acetyltransferase